jgi:hypothetical protein
MNQITSVSTETCIVGPYSRAAALALQAAEQLYQEARRFEQVTITLVGNLALVSRPPAPRAVARTAMVPAQARKKS